MGGASSKAEGKSSEGIEDKAEASLPSTIFQTSQYYFKIHKVSPPEKKGAISAVKQGLRELFFPDDPLHQFKDKTLFNKLILALHYLFPIFQWAPHYSLQFLKSDFISGLTVASLAIPQGISYAKLANLPPNIGLYSNFVPPLIYAMLGSCRDLAVGPVSISSVVMGSMLRDVVSPEKQPLLYLRLALTATLFAGFFQASLGLFRLGFMMDFLSKPTLMGFMGGAAVITAMQQLKNLLGMSHFDNNTGLVDVLLSVFKNRTEWTWTTMLMGFSFVVFVMIAKTLSSKRPNLFWVPVTAPFASMILYTIIVYATKAQNHGIHTIGYVKEGINHPSVKILIFQAPYLGYAIKTGVAIGILSLTDALAAGKTFASMNNYTIDGNKEMMAIGIMNIIGSTASCYVTSGSISKSAVNHHAGCKTQASNVVTALVVLLIMKFWMPLFYYTPDVILSMIIVIAVIKLIDFKSAIRLWKIDKLDFVTYLTAFLGVIFISVQFGLFIAVGTSIFRILLQVTRPNIVIMGNVPGTRSYRNLEQYKDAVRVSSFLVLGVESPIYFANSTYFNDRVLRWVREEEERAASLKESGIRCVILNISTVTAVDTTGIDALLQLRKALKNKSLQLVLANPVGDVAEKLRASKAWEIFGSKRIYMSVDEAIAALSCLLKGMPSDVTFNKESWVIYDNQAFKY